MISIFNGRKRSLGEDSRKEVYLQLEVAFRRYMHHFKGAMLSVFFSIGLHVDERGWSWPKVSTICKESGYGDNVVHQALNKLCQLKIKGRRVMLRAKEAPSHYVPNPREKNYARNFYLLFPSDAEIEKYEGEGAEPPDNANHLPQTIPKKRVAFLGIKKVDTVFESQSLITKEEPVLKEEPIRDEEEPTHTQPEPAPSLFASTAQDSVCVSDELTFDDYLGYARSQPSIHSPEGWTMKHYALRDADKLVREWLERQQPEAIAAARVEPEKQNLFFDEAAHRVRTLMQYGQDPRAIIDSMPLDDDVKQRLIEKFVTQTKVSHV